MLARAQSQQREREFAYSGQDFERVRRILYEHAGISLNDGKSDLVYGRLSRRLRALKFDCFAAYLEYLDSAAGEAEMVNFVNALTTNLTAFFREPHHFEFLSGQALPELAQAHQQDRRVRLWSAGCSTGEEPYSIAMVLAESSTTGHGWDTKLLATDLDSNVVATARQGNYTARRIAGLSKARAKKWFHRYHGQDSVQVNDDLRRLITFKQLNLMHEWPMRGPFDIIFCRNVIIYFDKPTQQRLFARYAEMLADGGYLFLGHSESMHNLCDRFELIGKTIYRKVR